MNNKRLVSFVLALMLVLSLNVAAFATGGVELTTEDSAEVKVTTTASVVYLVTIPADLELSFGETDQVTFGNVQLNTAESRLHENGSITVSLSSSTDFKLLNGNLSVPFVVNQKSGTDTPSYTVFSTGALTVAASTIPLTVQVSDWSGATKAGSYAGTVTFTIQYNDGSNS